MYLVSPVCIFVARHANEMRTIKLSTDCWVGALLSCCVALVRVQIVLLVGWRLGGMLGCRVGELLGLVGCVGCCVGQLMRCWAVVMPRLSCLNMCIIPLATSVSSEERGGSGLGWMMGSYVMASR